MMISTFGFLAGRSSPANANGLNPKAQPQPIVRLRNPRLETFVVVMLSKPFIKDAASNISLQAAEAHSTIRVVEFPQSLGRVGALTSVTGGTSI